MIIVRDFSTPLSTTDRSPRQKINIETLYLSYTLDQMNLTELYRTFIPSNSSKIHIFLKNTENILQDRSYIRPQDLTKKSIQKGLKI